MDDSAVRTRVARVGTLLDAIASLDDPNAQSTAAEAVQVILELYGEGLARIMELTAVPGGEAIVERYAGDELVSHLLLLHGLHPLSLEERVAQALDEVRPYLGSHGGDVELLGVEDGVARLRLEGSCHGCPSSPATLKLAIEEALERAAPDLEGLEVEGVAETQVREPLTFVDTAAVPDGGGKESSAWEVAGGLPQLCAGVQIKEVAGEPLLFLGIDDALYAYRPACPSCGSSLGDASLEPASEEAAGIEGNIPTSSEMTLLRCADCGARYAVRSGGRCAGDPNLFLQPVPLLISGQGIVKVALGGVAV